MYMIKIIDTSNYIDNVNTNINVNISDTSNYIDNVYDKIIDTSNYIDNVNINNLRHVKII